MKFLLRSVFNLPKFFIIAYIALIVGTLDIVAAMVVNRIPPDVMFKFIASGFFGRQKAFTGAMDMVAAGVFFHYFIAWFWTALFFVFYPFIVKVKMHLVIRGFLYGILIWVIMNFLVLPFSRIPNLVMSKSQVVIGVVILVLMVGIPISYLTHIYFRLRERYEKKQQS